MRLRFLIAKPAATVKTALFLPRFALAMLHFGVVQCCHVRDRFEGIAKLSQRKLEIVRGSLAQYNFWTIYFYLHAAATVSCLHFRQLVVTDLENYRKTSSMI